MSNYKPLRKSVSVLASILIVAGTIAMVSSLNSIQAYPGKGNYKDMTFGGIASIQNNEQGKPSWVLGGHWATNIINKTADDFNQTNPAKFDSWFYMTMLDGTAMHKHNISNFTLNDVTKQDNNTLYKGTVTITLKDGPVEKVPIEIKVANNHVIALSMDPGKTNNHFGDTPVYGLVAPKDEMMNMKSHMGNNMSDMRMNMSK